MYYKYYTDGYKMPRVYINKYFDFQYKLTYQPLYTYYRPTGLYYPMGYYSEKFNQTYYDGYGFNFYTKMYGYYEYSHHPVDPDAPRKGAVGFLLDRPLLSIMLGLAVLFIICLATRGG